MEKEEFSYHIFSFPFIINKWNSSNEFDLNIMKEKMEKKKKAKVEEGDCDYWKLVDQENTEEKEKNKKNYVWNITNSNYSTNVYFYKHVREAIFNISKENKSNEIVLNYNYNLIEDDNKYIIEVLKYDGKVNDKRNCENCILVENEGAFNKYEKKEYSLDIEKIELKIYETGVGILSFFLSNKEHGDFNDILNINNQGRRIYPSFFSKNDPSRAYGKNESKIKVIDAKMNNELANKITLKINNNEISEDFGYEIDQKLYLNKIRLANHVKHFLKFSENGKEIFEVQPIIDDRMFVISYLIQNKDNFNNKKNVKTDKWYKFIKTDHTTLINKFDIESDEWYKYVFIDSNSMMVQNDEMKKELINKVTYKRWTKYNTYFGITRYSFVLYKSIEAPFINDHMKTMYYEMVCLILAQRASILKFSAEVSEISSLDEKDTKRIKEIYANYIKFTNRLYFREVCAQEQGIEIYEMLQDITKVKYEIIDLKDEMEKLFDFANYLESEKSKESLEYIENLNKKLLIPTFITGLLGINIFAKNFKEIEGFLPNNIDKVSWSGYIGFFINLMLVIIIIIPITKIGLRLLNDKKHKEGKK